MTFIYMLVCAGAANCPTTPIYSSKVFFTEKECREWAPEIATYMHYSSGGDWSWKCFVPDYSPKEIK